MYALSCRFAALFFVASTLVAVASGDEAGCPTCGRCSPTKKVCRLVCETETKKRVEYACEQEDFCIPGPSKYLGQACVSDPENPCRNILKKIWQPTCARVRTRSILLKREVPYEVHKYHWVVDEVCGCCGQHCRQLHKVAASAEELSTGAPEGLLAMPE